MTEQLLKNPNVQPTDEILRTVLGDSFTAWCLFSEKLQDYSVSFEWRYYKDGGWLIKGSFKKTTVFWGHASDGCFTIALHFNQKTRIGVMELDISDGLKNSFANAPTNERSVSIVNDIYNESQLSDVFELIDYKKRAK